MILTDKHKIRIKEILKLPTSENKLTELKQYLFSIEGEIEDVDCDLSRLAWQIVREHEDA